MWNSYHERRKIVRWNKAPKGRKEFGKERYTYLDIVELRSMRSKRAK